jgi:hypothetical protein
MFDGRDRSAVLLLVLVNSSVANKLFTGLRMLTFGKPRELLSAD